MRATVQEFFIVLSALVGLTVLATYPLVFHFSTSIPSGEPDIYINSWSLWWFDHALRQLKHTPFMTNYLFFPWVVDISGDISIIYGLLLSPIVHFFNHAVAYNCRIFLTYICTGLGMYVFIKSIVKERLSAFIGMIVFTFSYYRNTRATQGHIDLASTDWYGFFLTFFFGTILTNKSSIWFSILSGIAFALEAYTDIRNALTLLLYFLVVMTIHWILCVAKHKWELIISNIKQIMVLAITVIILCSPLIVLHKDKLGDHIYGVRSPFANALPLSYIYPPKNAIVSAFFLGKLGKVLPLEEQNIVYISIVAIILMACWVYDCLYTKRIRHIEALLLLSFLLFIWFATDAWFRLYTFLTPIEIFLPLRVGSRLVVLAEISVAVFAALGHLVLVRRSQPSRALVVTIIVSILLFIDTCIAPLQTVSTQVSAGYVRLADAPPGTVLELPFGFRDINHTIGTGKNDISLLHQTIHEKPFFGGLVTWLPENTWNKINHDTVVKKLADCQENSICIPLNFDEKTRLIHLYGIRYIVVPEREFRSQIAIYLEAMFTFQTIYTDTEVHIFKLEIPTPG